MKSIRSEKIKYTEESKKIAIAVTPVYCRVEPSQKADICAVANTGEEFEVIEENDEWLHLADKGWSMKIFFNIEIVKFAEDAIS